MRGAFLPGLRGDLLAVLAAGIAAAALALATTFSPQLGLTLALVGLAYALWVADRRAAIVLIWLMWLLAPGVRRLLGLTGFVQTDPLSVAPFLVTGLVATLEWARRPQPATVRRVTVLVTAGWAIGLITGLAAGPPAAIYTLCAYVAAVAAFTIGWNEPARRASELTLVRTLIIGGPALAAYGVAQYLLPLPSWDRLWLQNVDVVTFGAPEDGHVRVFSTLNAPGLLAAVLALTLLAYLARRRADALTAFAVVVVLAALSFTYVRASWLALAVAALVTAVLLGRFAIRRLALVAAVCLLVPVALAPASPTAAALVKRFDTFGSLSSDTSANARVAAPQTLVPELLTQPLGKGLGTAGEGSKLNATSNLRAPDNGYLSLLYQAGPVGFLLVLSGLGVALAAAVPRAWARRREDGALILGGLVFILLFMVSGDHFYGAIGAVLWYLLGAGAHALWREEDDVTGRRWSSPEVPRPAVAEEISAPEEAPLGPATAPPAVAAARYEHEDERPRRSRGLVGSALALSERIARRRGQP